MMTARPKWCTGGRAGRLAGSGGKAGRVGARAGTLTEVDSLRHLAPGHGQQDGTTAVLTGLGQGRPRCDHTALHTVTAQPARLPLTSWYFSRATLVSALSCVSMKSSLFR